MKKIGFLSGSVLQNLLASAEDVDLIPWVGKIPCKRKWQPTPVFLAWEIPWTEEPGRLQCHRVAKYQARLSDWTHTWRRRNSRAGLPWWLSGKESTCQCRGCGFNPWPGKIPQATEQLSPCATITEPVVLSSPGAATAEATCTLEPVIHKERSRQNEKSMHHSCRVAPTGCNQRKAYLAVKTQHCQK